MMLPLKMEAVRIRTQPSGVGVGGCFKTHITKHFLPTPRAPGSQLKRRKVRRERSSCQQGGGPGMGVCGGHSSLDLRPLPTTPPVGSG